MSTRTRQATATEAFDMPNEAHALEVSTTYPLSEPTREARGRLGRYARVQAQDFFVRQGVMMTVLALALAVPMMMAARNSGDAFPEIVRKIFGFVSGTLVGVGTLLATRGIVSDDTQHGFHRFLFSKPLVIERYYAQSFAVRFAGFMAMLLVLMLPFTLFAAVPVVQMLAVGAIVFTLLGGVGFLLSTLSRLDTGLVLALAAVTAAVQGMSHAPPFSFLRPLAVILPPLEQLGQVLNYILRDVAFHASGFPVGSLLWVLAYGAGSFVAGLAILRRRAVPA